MCGIVGYIGKGNVKEILLDSLQRLEYRGYDSAGIALLDTSNKIEIFKKTGRISNLRLDLHSVNSQAKMGIGHTRWATHGGVTNENAHPHFDCGNNIALVHNGIIENYNVLKNLLEKKGHKFNSETDTEILVHLIEDIYKTEKISLEESVIKALNLVQGTYGIALISSYEPNKIICARNGSPLVVGMGQNEMFVASDVNAIIPYTRNVIYLEDKEMVVINEENCNTFNLNYEKIVKPISKVEWDLEAISQNGYETFMLKEIFEQPDAMLNAMRGRVNLPEGAIKFGGLNLTEAETRDISRIIITACGTSWHAALVGEYLIETFAKIPVEVDYASEFRYRNPIIQKNDILLVISQSGETLDTLEALREAKRKGIKVLGITNVVGSTIARECDGGIYLHAGPEIGVASTKAFTNQVIVMIMLAIYLGRLKHMSFYEGQRLLNELNKIPEKVNEVLKQAEKIKAIAKKYQYAKNFLYLGRGFNYPVALEGALKLKEISYIHAEGYPAAEMKHGPIALIDENMPVVFLATTGPLYDKVISNIREVKARNGRIIAIVNQLTDDLSKYTDDVVIVPETFEEFSPLVNVVPLQLLAYYIAREKNLDVDKPRNLAKSVTVE
ncbi:MAG: glutamine--fructose-6-phosphate transaminase (isomerizing) [Brevinematales bacterium]|nr:glutamine--fructose-6-phosphate transaminase (isomerizing) [Brevinematales bacterium]